MSCVGLLTDCASHHWLKMNSGPITKMVFWFFCVFTAVFISLVVLKAACHITVLKMLWCHSWASSELYKFFSKRMAEYLSCRLEENVPYILNYFRPSAWGVSLPSVIYLYILLFQVYALLRSRIYIFMFKTFYFWDSSWLYSIQLELRENWKM